MTKVSRAALRRPRFSVDGWSVTKQMYLANMARSRKEAHAYIEQRVFSQSIMPSVKDVCTGLGYELHDKSLIRFRILWREYFQAELPRLERTGKIGHAQMLSIMRSIGNTSSKWLGDKELRRARLLWFCDHLLNHTDLHLTNREINKVAFGKDDKDLSAPSYTKVIREFREKELGSVLGQLMLLPVREIVDRPTGRAQALLARLGRLWVPKLQVPPKIDAAPLIRAVCDHIVASQKVVPTYNGLREILDFIPSNNVKGHGFMGILKQWRRDRGFPDSLRGTMNPALPRTWEMLLPTLGKPIRQAPHTFLDPRAKPGRYRRLGDEVAGQLGKCEDLTIRSALTLAVLSSCGNHDTIPGFAAGLKQIIEAGKLRGLTDARLEDALRAFVTGDLVLEEAPDDTGDDENGDDAEETGPSDDDDEQDQRWSQNKIRDFFRVYRAASFAQQRYLNDLTKKQRKEFSPYLLPKLQDQVFWKARNFNYIVEAVTRKRRKERTDALFPHRGVIRTLPEFRTNQALRIQTVYRAELAKVQRGEVVLPHAFTVYEDEPHLGSPARHQFKLWSQSVLWSALLPSERNRSPRWVDEDKTRFFVEYLGAIGDDGEPSTNELWFADLIRYNACHVSPLRDARTAELLRSYGITKNQYKALWAMLCGNRQLSYSLARLIGDIRETRSDFRPIYFSPEGLHQVCLFGRVANRILNVTGCRVNELQQVHASADCLLKIPLERRSAAFAFMAIPKLREELEPFFIDESCVKFIAELATCIGSNSPTGYLPKVAGAGNLPSHKRSQPRPYLFQYVRREPRAMRAGLIGSLVRFMLHGLLFTTVDGRRFQPGLHDLRHLTGATLRSQGIPIEVIAKMFKQKDLSVTDYYSEPTNSMVVAAMHGLQMAVIGVGTATGIRTASELNQQLSDANGVVGALTRTNGGTCTVNSPCAAKFACLGCPGLVPDPKQRHHVERNKGRLQEDLVFYIEHGMLAEVRKNEKHIADCDRVLAEMDLQEAAAIDATKEKK